MTTSDPLSLAEAKRLATVGRHDPAARHPLGRPRDADRRVPAPRRWRAGLPARVRRGRRAPRPLLVPRRRARAGSSRCATARRPSRRGRSSVDAFDASLPIERSRRADPLEALRAFVPRRRVVPVDGMPRFTGGAVGRARLRRGLGVRADGAAARRRSRRRADGRVHRDGPRARLRPPDAHAVGDRVAAHGRARPRGPLRDRRTRDLRGARADGATVSRRDRRQPRPGACSRRRRRERHRRPGRSTPSADPDEPRPRRSTSEAVRVAKEAIASGEAIQVVLARRQSIELPVGPSGGPLDGIELYRALRRDQSRARTSTTSGCRASRSSARRRNCCSRSRATA